MRKSLQEKYLERMCLILRELSRRPLSRIELQRRFLQRFDSPSAFEGTFAFLVRDGRIQKGGSEHRAPYRLTERGQKLLEALA
jgi:DNA-binding PadR family transcriptional regulator